MRCALGNLHGDIAIMHMPSATYAAVAHDGCRNAYASSVLSMNVADGWWRKSTAVGLVECIDSLKAQFVRSSNHTGNAVRAFRLIVSFVPVESMDTCPVVVIHIR